VLIRRIVRTLTRAGLTTGIINTAVVGSGALLQPLIGWLLNLCCVSNCMGRQAPLT
jgi:hypothetical protein